MDALCTRVYVFEDRFGFGGTPLESLRAAAAERGWDNIACMCPEEPRRIEHLLIPGLGLAFVTSRPGMEYPGSPARRVRLDALAEVPRKARFRFEARMAALLREDGAAALREAKENHDALEGVYNPHVDFDGVRALASVEADRLLGWMSEGKRAV